jgi:hypothetical protein
MLIHIHSIAEHVSIRLAGMSLASLFGGGWGVSMAWSFVDFELHAETWLRIGTQTCFFIVGIATAYCAVRKAIAQTQQSEKTTAKK